MFQIPLFDSTIIPKICSARNKYISSQPKRGRWVSGRGWEYFPDVPPYIPPTHLHMSDLDIALLRAFFALDPAIPTKNLQFWGCAVVSSSTFHPYFSHDRPR